MWIYILLEVRMIGQFLASSFCKAAWRYILLLMDYKTCLRVRLVMRLARQYL